MKRLSDEDMAEVLGYGKEYLEKQAKRKEAKMFRKILQEKTTNLMSLIKSRNMYHISFNEIRSFLDIWENIEESRIPNDVKIQYDFLFKICHNLINAFNSSFFVFDDTPVSALTKDVLNYNCMNDFFKHEKIDYTFQLHGRRVEELLFTPGVGQKGVKQLMNNWIALGHTFIGHGHCKMFMW